MSVPDFKQIYITLFLQKLLGVSKFGNWVMCTRPRLLWGRFIFRTLEGSVVHRFTKFDADGSIRSKVINGVPKIWKLGHVTLATPT